jgi:hypothetical protein
MQNWGPTDHVRAVVADPSAHPDRLLGAIAMLASARECLEDAEADLVTRARAAGLTWREIAAAMSLGSPQAAAQRAHRRPPRGERVPEQQRRGENGDTEPDRPRDPRAIVHHRPWQPSADDGAVR